MERLVVLGGSSPFTLGLIDALLTDSSLQPHELVLYGRRGAHLDLVSEYARPRLGPLGWAVTTSTQMTEALRGADFILHQIRYGGPEGRVEDEQLALEFGSVADETLGPGALNAALRMVPTLRTVAATISEMAPEAWVLNLTNPLSIAVAILAEQGVKRCIGLCELPLTTARMVASILDTPLHLLDWDYRGFNHRGYIVRLAYRGVDQFPPFLRRLGNHGIGGIPAAVIAELGAVPTKYFALMKHGSGGFGRAKFIRLLRDRILLELQSNPHLSPPSLRRRRIDWYQESVVPTLAALHTSRPSRHIVNASFDDGLIREVHANLSAEAILPEPLPDAPLKVQEHLTRFERHERRVLEAVLQPSLMTIKAALTADPTVNPNVIPPLANALWKRHANSVIEDSPVPLPLDAIPNTSSLPS